MSLSVVLAGGGTAGHVEPALATAERLSAAGHRVVLLGTSAGVEARLVPARGYVLRTIPKVPFPRRLGPGVLRLPFAVWSAVREAGVVLDDVAADVVVGFGGYVAFPAYLAARRRRLGIVVHEANPLPGLANRVGARLTRWVAVARPGTALAHARVVGIPLRPEITSIDRVADRVPARARLALDPGRFTVLVFGGSQGSASLNSAVLGSAGALTGAGLQVLLAAGPAQAEALSGALEGSYVRVVPYLEDMAAAYAAADLVVCRAGAMTCAELGAVGLPAVYVPLAIGNGEQRRNAEPAVAAGGGVFLDDATVRDRLGPLVLELAGDPARLAAMSRAAARSQPSDAAGELLAMVESAAGTRSRHPLGPPVGGPRGRHRQDSTP